MLTPDQVAGIESRLGGIRHVHIEPGKCSCGFDAYKIVGILIDYRDETEAHFRRVRNNPPRASVDDVRALLDERRALLAALESYGWTRDTDAVTTTIPARRLTADHEGLKISFTLPNKTKVVGTLTNSVINEKDVRVWVDDDQYMLFSEWAVTLERISSASQPTP